MEPGNTLDLATIHLEPGTHDAHRPGEWSLMEAVAWAAGEPWTDHPACVSPVIGEFCRAFNDRLDDRGRQKLVPYIVKVRGTNTGAGDDEVRRLLAAAKFAALLPDWLDAADLPEAAARARSLGIPATEEERVVARTVLRDLADLAWNRRWPARGPEYEQVQDAIRLKVGDHQADQGVAVATAAGASAATAATVAAALPYEAAAADAATSANGDVATAAAAVAAVAAEALAAAAAPVAAEAAVAAGTAGDAAAAEAGHAAASSERYWAIRGAAYKAVRPIYERTISESPLLSELVQRTENVGFELLDEMCAVGGQAEEPPSGAD